MCSASVVEQAFANFLFGISGVGPYMKLHSNYVMQFNPNATATGLSPAARFGFKTGLLDQPRGRGIAALPRLAALEPPHHNVDITARALPHDAGSIDRRQHRVTDRQFGSLVQQQQLTRPALGPVQRR